MEIWRIDLNSDECQYCAPPYKAGKNYICKFPGENYGKECVEGTCPVAVLTTAVPVNNNS